ncbi:MAG: FMN-binding protein [Proteobacteria bacterium]|nr:FMN-binding protein [Pseudomonadota bacterium]
MKKINKTSPIYFISFFTVIIFGIILGVSVVHEQLKEKISLAKAEEVQTFLKRAMACENILKKTLNNNTFFYCKNKDLIAQHLFSKKAYADKIEYLLFTNFEGYVKHIDIISHKETPGLGNKIEKQSWIKTIYNKPINVIRLKSDGGEIDSFTSASITPRILLENIAQQSKWIKEHKQQIIRLISSER